MSKKIEAIKGLWVGDFHDKGKAWEYTIEIAPKYGCVRYMGEEDLRALYGVIEELLWERVNDTTDTGVEV